MITGGELFMPSRGLALTLTALLAGCVSTAAHYSRNTSVVDYLYPTSKDVEVSTEVPKLTLPLKVGIAFVPAKRFVPTARCREAPCVLDTLDFGWAVGSEEAAGLTEAKKAELMASVSSHFKELDFVDSIEIIPSAYLRPAGSFENLDQLRRMFGIDVIALLSYDQTRFTDQGLTSLAYWTIVGAYIVPAEKNSTHTLMDAVVYDIPSRKLLFRAPGTSSVKSSATLVALDQQVREDAVQGFELASANLVENLKVELESFKERIKEAPDQVQIASRDGHQASGSGGLVLVLAALLGLVGAARRRLLR
ncbi:MAG TPA: rhombotarget lipoprotein [Pseudomonadales bacterium]